MGYVSTNIGDLTGGTCTRPIKLAWTKIGREYLIGKRANRKKGITIKYFSVGDSDINYQVADNNLVGFVPNITGIEDDCLIGTMKDSFEYNVNYNREGLIIVKDLTINFNDNPSTLIGCTPSSLLYDIYLNGVTILKQQFNYNYLFAPSTFYSLIDIDNKKNDILTNYITNSILSNIDLTINTIETSVGSGVYTIQGYIIKIKDQSSSLLISDNSSSICNNLIKSNTTIEQKVISNPSLVVTENVSTFFIPACGS